MSRIRFILVLVLLVAVPTGLLAWLGNRLRESELHTTRERVQELLRGNLREHDRLIQELLAKREREMLMHTPDEVLQPETRAVLGMHPLFDFVFVLDVEGKFLYPIVDSPTLSEGERELLARLRPLQEAGGLMFHSAEPVSSSQAESQSSQPQQKVSVHRPPERRQASVSQASPARNGWHPWFWHDGLHLIYRHRSADGTILAFELNRARLLADIVAALPDTPVAPVAGYPAPSSRIVLRNANGDALYQWGNYEPDKDTHPHAILPLSHPLSSWQLAYFADVKTLPGGGAAYTTRGLALAIVAVALVMSGLATVIYRASSRRLAEASTRVSFVNRVSHELKTPLTNIRLYGELLEDEIEEEEATAKRYVTVIRDESRRLSRLIHNVLSFSRSQRSRLQIHRREVALDALVSEALEQFSIDFDEKGIKLETDLGFGREVQADPDAVEQVLVNLLSNASKYAVDGHWLGVRTGEVDGHAFVRIADHGPGIPARSREKVFEPFHRLSDRLSEGVSGTGIGLTISRELARMHGGDLRVLESEHGALFEFLLPLEEGSCPGG